MIMPRYVPGILVVACGLLVAGDGNSLPKLFADEPKSDPATVRSGDEAAQVEGRIADEIKTLKENLIDQEIATKRAIADKENARLTLEVAEISVDEYTDGTLPQTRKSYEKDIAKAEADLNKAKERYNWAVGAEAKGYMTHLETLAEKYTKENAEFTLAKARKQKEVLDYYTSKKDILRSRRTSKRREKTCTPNWRSGA